MPCRIIKDTICTSESVNKLTWFEEVFWCRLLLCCDDYGRLEARHKILKSKLFPLKDGVTDKQVAGALDKLQTVNMVQVYMYDQKPYLQLVAWQKHNTPRAKKSKYPDPPEMINENVLADENTCEQMSPYSNSVFDIRYSNSYPPTPQGGFEEFWKAYPKKQGKAGAEKAFIKLSPPDELLDTMLKAIASQAKSEQWLKDSGQYIPYPATWLNGKRWEDEITVTKRSSYLDVANKITERDNEHD